MLDVDGVYIIYTRERERERNVGATRGISGSRGEVVKTF